MSSEGDGHLKAKQKGPRRNQPYLHPDLPLLASNIVRKYIFAAKLPSVWYFVMAALAN